MPLTLNEKYKYTNPYRTNWDYLHNLTEPQMKALEGMSWIEASKYIHTDLWSVPWILFSKGDAERSVNYFIRDLNSELKRL